MIKVTLLFVGLRGRDNKFFDAWVDLTGKEACNEGSEFKQDDHIDPYMFNYKNRLAEATPGQIFSFDAEHADKSFTVQIGSGQYLGMWLNVPDVTKWQAAHLAVVRTAEMAEVSKKEGANRFDLEALRPFREAHRVLQPDQQQMLLAQIIEFITRPKKKKKK